METLESKEMIKKEQLLGRAARGRTLVIADTHGGLKALVQLMKRAKITSKDTVIFLGDYCDGWGETADLLDFLIKLQQENPHWIFLKGNHDAWAQEYLFSGIPKKEWLENGGQTTFDSYAEHDKMQHYWFIKNTHLYYVDDENRGYVHGGFVSKYGLGHDTNLTDYYWNRDMWHLALSLKGKDDEVATKHSTRFYNHKEVYIGHTATTGWDVKPHYPEYQNPQQADNGPITVPMNRCNVWNIDTGGGGYGKLSCIDVDTKQVWQSDFVKDLYPEFHEKREEKLKEDLRKRKKGLS